MKDIITNIKNFQYNIFSFNKSGNGEQANSVVVSDVEILNIIFELKYKEMTIGTLKYINNEWSFSYSESFKIQNEIAPVVSFPDTKKEYQSKDLWSFFTSRIPDDANSMSGTKEHKNNADFVQQLKDFGRKSITNPFELYAV